jgi:glycosyltransferase involved in cell wall biosynthesis
VRRGTGREAPASVVTVLCFADTRFPIERANGAQTMATCHALAARGHAVTLVVRPDSVRPPRDPFAFYGLPGEHRLTVRAVPNVGDGHVRRAHFLLAAAALAARSADVLYTRDLGLASFLLQLPFIGRGRVVYESHGIADVVSAELPRLLGTHTPRPSSAKLARLARRDARVWRKAASYVTITETLAADLVSRFGAREHVFVVPDGALSTPAGGGDTPPGPPPGTVVVGYAGHLYPWKGVDVLIRAIARQPTVQGVIVGGHPAEPDRQRVERLAHDLGVANRVTFTGMVPPGDVRRHLAPATILVLPNTSSTISERYTSPLKLFEYLAMGRAIVASDLPAVREILSDETTALLVPPDDPIALGAAIARLGADPVLVERLGAAALKLAPEYSWARRAERLESALEAAIA